MDRFKALLAALLLLAGLPGGAQTTGPVTATSQTSSSANANGIGAGSSIGNTTIHLGGAPASSTVNQVVSGGTTNVNRNINEGSTTQHQVLSGGTTNVNRNINEGVQVQHQVLSGGTSSSQSLVTESRTENMNVTRMEGETTQRQVIEGEQRVRIEYGGTQTLRNVPSVHGPPLTTSNDTCMGSTSGSINGPGFGIGVGSTWTDRNCVMLKNARELWNMGMKAAAMALFCTDEANRNALEVTGFICPQTALRQAEAARQQQGQPESVQPARWRQALDPQTPLPAPVLLADEAGPAASRGSLQDRASPARPALPAEPAEPDGAVVVRKLSAP